MTRISSSAIFEALLEDRSIFLVHKNFSLHKYFFDLKFPLRLFTLEKIGDANVRRNSRSFRK
ncbi:unknown protein [Simkania negevensis Z]|uniref:Uncharacterized protein n=1 Tax=Simkania negevensis (strain ATCC VR-1471 / DSM 27360 / Z) TaxID=331113 RepID=F8L6J4_SIMNZ|nr:unknown protein [Simkania negevensis Z]